MSRNAEVNFILFLKMLTISCLNVYFCIRKTEEPVLNDKASYEIFSITASLQGWLEGHVTGVGKENFYQLDLA